MLKLNNKSTQRFSTGLLFLLALAFICALAVDSGADQATTIRFKERVEVDADDVLLGQIATIEGGDVRFMQDLKNIVIGKAPAPADSRQFEKKLLHKRLSQHKIDPAKVVVETPASVEVIRGHIEIQNQEIEKIVSNFIIQQTPAENRAVRIKEIQAPESVVLPKGRITYQVTARRSRRLMGRCPLAVDFSINGHTQKRVWVTAMVEVLGPVVVTRKPLGRYKPITEDDIEVRTLDLANLPKDVLSDPDAVIGKRTRRAIGTQTPLRANSIELPPLVKRGDLVVIVAESKSMKITTLGEVKRKGRLGDRIPVVNLDSKKVLHALVVDANTVKVDF